MWGGRAAASMPFMLSIPLTTRLRDAASSAVASWLARAEVALSHDPAHPPLAGVLDTRLVSPVV
jgi:hypothetical protein